MQYIQIGIFDATANSKQPTLYVEGTVCTIYIYKSPIGHTVNRSLCQEHESLPERSEMPL